MSLSKRDFPQVLKGSFDDANGALRFVGVGGTLVPEKFDELDLSYIPSGNGAGNVGTVVYKLSGTTIATLTLVYDASGNLTTVNRS